MFKSDVHEKYTRKDFQRMELRHLLYRVGGYIFVLLPLYLYLHSQFPQYALVWGIPLLLLAIFFAQQAEVMHIDKMPLSYYSRPQTLVKFLLDPQFCREEKLERKTLLIETITFYIYLVAVATELFFGSYFLLVFHLIPGLINASSQILGAVIVHSGIDNRNSFESNGIFDFQTAKGLFKVPLWFFGLLNHGFFVNHGIHHAYPQVPLEIINKNYKRYHHKILKDYTGVRYNTVVSHVMFKPLLENLKEKGIWVGKGAGAVQG